MKKALVIGAVVVALAIGVPLALMHRVEVAEREHLHFDASTLATQPNATATALQHWSIRLLPQGAESERVILDYLAAQKKSAIGFATPNAFVQHYRAADLDEFANFIATSDPPRWPERLASPSEGVPYLFETRKLNQTLLACAMARSAAGDRAGANRLLECSWRLTGSMRSNPILIVQLMSVAIFRDQLAALRKIDVDAAVWLPRLREVDYVRTFAVSESAWARNLDDAVRRNVYADGNELRNERRFYAAIGMPAPFRPQWLQLLRTPVRWFDLPHALAGSHAVTLAAASVPRSEHIDRDLAAAYTRGASEFWYIADPDVPGGDRTTAFRRAVRAQAECELTQKVISAR